MEIKIDVSLIPPVEQRRLAKTFLEAVKRFYADPENVRKFEEWKKSQEERDAAEDAQADKTKTNKREG